MRARALLLAPFRLLWTLIKVVFWPAVFVAAAWWLLPGSWALAITWVIGLYLAVVLLIFRAAWREKSFRRSLDLLIRKGR
jgi:ABC-type multidrug transport system fused ATPase/permease subunit